MEKLIHLLLPRVSNNHKAKIIHSQSLLVIALLFVFGQAIISLLPKVGSNILGYASNISPEEVVRLTNAKRASAGLTLLSYNSTLASAAYTKGTDMIAKDYWAHTAPDGTLPWKFFSDFGYKYRYAGENLARDFSNASSAVEAWMNSPTHRENILNPNYKEIGIGVVEGDLAGIDTTIIVQFFGSTFQDKISQPLAQAPAVVSTITPAPTSAPFVLQAIDPTPTPTPVSSILISPFTVTRSSSLIVVAILLVVFLVDMVIVGKRRIVRIGGKALAHAAFFGMILAIIVILQSGRII